MTDQAFLGTIQLLSGAHNRGQGMCAMEAAAYLAGEPHSDHPECVSPVIASFMRGWNDGMRSDAERELLKPWVVKVLHTRTLPQDEETRAFLALDWLVRVETPAWLDLAGLTEHSARLRALPALTTSEITLAAQQTISAARDAARDAARAAARDAARDAAWDAARAAAIDAAWDAARDAARAAARDAAIDAAWDAGRDAARAAAIDAARAAAIDAAWDAAIDAARAAAGNAAAKNRLEPTVQQLQASAFALLDRMIAVGTPREAPIVAAKDPVNA